MKAIKIIEKLKDWAPDYLIEDWDNTGFQVGDPEKKVERILISLDLDERVFKKAVENKVDMIVTHHPLIFSPLKSITRLDPKEKLIYDIIREGIVVYNAHTNLDLAIGGVNDALAQRLSLEYTEALNIAHEEEVSRNGEKELITYGYGRIGTIGKIPLKAFLDQVKENLDVDGLTVYGDMDIDVERVAVCGGSGSSFIHDAYLKDADVYVTGDIKYHEAQYAEELGLTLIDAGHYHTEKVILPVVKEYLEEALEAIDIQLYNESSPSYTVY